MNSNNNHTNNKMIKIDFNFHKIQVTIIIRLNFYLNSFKLFIGFYLSLRVYISFLDCSK